MTTPDPAVRLATLEDAGAIADLLADAFLDYEWSRWAVRANNRRERLRGLHLLYAGLLGAETGSTWVTDDISLSRQLGEARSDSDQRRVVSALKGT